MPGLPTIRRGPALMALAALAFSLMVALVKVARADMDAMELMFWRGLITIPMTGWLARDLGLRVHNKPVLLLRSVFGFCAMTCWFTAAIGLPLTTMSLIGKLQPLVLAVLAPLILGAGELLDGRARTAVGVGLVGCALIIGPELTLGGHFGLLALGGTLFSAFAHLCLRHLGRTEAPAIIVFWFQVLITVYAATALSAGVGEGWRWPPGHLWLHLLGIGLFATLGQVTMTRAYQLDQAARVAVASYTAPLWSVGLDLALFGDLPGGVAIAGGLLVIGSGLLVVLPKTVTPTGRSGPS